MIFKYASIHFVVRSNELVNISADKSGYNFKFTEDDKRFYVTI